MCTDISRFTEEELKKIQAHTNRALRLMTSGINGHQKLPFLCLTDMAGSVAKQIIG